MRIFVQNVDTNLFEEKITWIIQNGYGINKKKENGFLELFQIFLEFRLDQAVEKYIKQ